MSFKILEMIDLKNVRLDLGDKVLGGRGNEEIIRLESRGVRLVVYDYLPDQEILQMILQVFGEGFSPDSLLSKLLSSEDLKSLVDNLEEVGKVFGVERVEYVEDKRKVRADERVFVLPIESATSGYLGSFIFKGDLDPTFVLSILSMKDTITSIAEGMILSMRMNELLRSALEALSSALESRVREGEKKKKFRENLAFKMNEKLGFDEEILKLALMIYDVGKIGVPDAITSKSPDELTTEEFEIFKKHVRYGYEILLGIKNIPREILEAILYHHERYDGSGYLEGLKGEEIPPLAMFVGFLDEVSYLSIERGLDKTSILKKLDGKFSPELLKIFEVIPC